ncbi:MAG: Uma2 family endonuclease [Deltaproteobacteria bacterium]|nr:Uma2 family endonuclease [Deltaproteobacteria bacterium]
MVYPDLMVICGPPRFHPPGPADTVLNPTVIVEVLSPSTEAYDRGDKFVAYRSIASLRHYVLVDGQRPTVEVFSPDASGNWCNTVFQGLQAVVELPAVGVTLPVAELHADLPP